MAFDHGTCPHQFAGIGLAGLDLTDHAEFTAGVAGDDQAIHDERCCGVAVAFLVFGNLLVPHDRAGLAVQRHETRIQSAEIDIVAVNRGTAVHDVTTGQNAFGKTGIVLPEFLAGGDVDRVHAAVGAGDVHGAVINDRLTFLPTLFLAAEAERPGGNEALHVLGVQRLKRGKPLKAASHAVGQYVANGFRILGELFFGHSGMRNTCARDSRNGGQHQTFHNFPPTPDVRAEAQVPPRHQRHSFAFKELDHGRRIYACP